MRVKQINENVWSVGAIDWKRRMFDEIVPLYSKILSCLKIPGLRGEQYIMAVQKV